MPLTWAISCSVPPPKNSPGLLLNAMASKNLVSAKKPDAERAEHAIGQVNRRGTDRIVGLDAVEEQHGQHHQHAGNRADDGRRHRADVRARCGDRHETGQATVQRHADIRLAQHDPAVAVAVSVATAAAVFVVTQMCEISLGITPIVLPGLKPNQPSHKMKQPIVAAVMLWPGMAWGLPSAEYLPMRGPSMYTPTSAAQPPIECTCVEPAKSRKPALASQPPPQIQWPTTG